MSAEAPPQFDEESRLWLDRLRVGSPRREEAVSGLRDILLRVAAHEMARRRRQLGAIAGPEVDDLVQQAANDALINILSKLDDFRGLSRFTTWACKFVIFEVSTKVARHAWRRHPPNPEQLSFDDLYDRSVPLPSEPIERREQLQLLAEAIQQLSERQRTVFVAIALNDVPIDVLALELDSNRNAIYKNLFDARRSLRDTLTAAGYPVGSDFEARK